MATYVDMWCKRESFKY